MAPPAHADKKRPVTPWSEGVTPAAQEAALALFQTGNVYFEQAKYTEAVERYEKALSAWDHPNIRFNMAVCFINMRQPLAAWDHLKNALRFGEPPLGKKLFADAQSYLAVLEASLGELTVKSAQPDVKIEIDGVQFLVGVGQKTTRLLAGKHQLVATRPGYITDSRALDLPAGTPVTEVISLTKTTFAVEVRRENYERRWGWWTPWAVTGIGLALGLTGTFLYVSARRDIEDYDRALLRECPAGCLDSDIPESLKDRETAAKRKSGVAIVTWSAAGGLALIGGVMAILNRPRKTEERRPTPTVTITPGYVGAGFSVSFE
ncbi:MAG: tetratricopeptide repeat protein [Kofleriaceae bacterium]